VGAVQVRLQIWHHQVVDDDEEEGSDTFSAPVLFMANLMDKEWVANLLDTYAGSYCVIDANVYKDTVQKAMQGMHDAGLWSPPTAPGQLPAKYRKSQQWFVNLLGYSSRRVLRGMYTTRF
jgi:hypothetical protein